MPDHIIEPSEIITGRDENLHVRPSRANPWIRLIARFFDYSIFFSILHLAIGKIAWPPFENFLPIEYFAWIPLETILLLTWGTTPGKWILRTELKMGTQTRIGFRTALRRSILVWFRGLGMSIPFLNALCMLNAFYRLRIIQTTSWDRDEGTWIVHHPLPKWRYYFAIIVVILGMTYYSFWKKSWF